MSRLNLHGRVRVAQRRVGSCHVTQATHQPSLSATSSLITMSAESVARWNAIPMTRPDNDGLSAAAKVLPVFPPYPPIFQARYYPVPLCFPSSDPKTTNVMRASGKMEVMNVTSSQMEMTVTMTSHSCHEVRLQLPRIRWTSINTTITFEAPSGKSSQSTQKSRAPIRVLRCCQN